MLCLMIDLTSVKQDCFVKSKIRIFSSREAYENKIIFDITKLIIHISTTLLIEVDPDHISVTTSHIKNMTGEMELIIETSPVLLAPASTADPRDNGNCTIKGIYNAKAVMKRCSGINIKFNNIGLSKATNRQSNK